MKSSTEAVSIIIRENAFFKGTLNTPESIKISGNYSGSIYCTKNVYVDATARIDGDIEAENIIISGAVRGNVKAKQRIHLTSTSKLEGDITTGSFKMDQGGIFIGKYSNTSHIKTNS